MDDGPERVGGEVESTEAPERHRFTDEEIRRILTQATELQLRQNAKNGLTLQALHEIAAEVGIDSENVNLALAAFSAEPASEGVGLAGGPRRWTFRRLAKGRVSPEQLDRMLHTIRTLMGTKGELDFVAGRMEWKGIGTRVGISGKGDVTEIEVIGSDFGESYLLHLGLPILGLVGLIIIAAIASVPGPAVLLMGLAGSIGGYFAARRLWRTRHHSHRGKFEELLERLAGEVSEDVLAATDQE